MNRSAAVAGARRKLVSFGRRVAAQILIEVERGRRLDSAWRSAAVLQSRERAWIRRTVYGTVRLRGRLDWVLQRVADREIAQMEPWVRTALRMGAYQILEMSSVPAYAAVSQSVELVRQGRSPQAAGLVNAVLRIVAKTRLDESNFPDPEEDLEGYLTTWGSHPAWLVRRWLAHFGERATMELVQANNREPEIYFRPVGVSLEAARRTLTTYGLLLASEEQQSDTPGACVRLKPGTDPMEAMKLIPGVIQDPAAAAVADFTLCTPGALVLDLCAAPGGKALALSAEAGAVVAGDISPTRILQVSEGAERLKANVWPVVADARNPPFRQAELVLADVPCSGTATFRRHPDGRWRIKQSTLHELTRLQRKLLDGAATAVRPGGLLVYATCALEPEENWDQVKSFLERNRDFRLDGPPPGCRLDSACIDANGCLVVLPHQSGFDGAFACRMRRLPN